MKPNSGRVAVVLPQGALFRAAKEQEIRKAFLEAKLVDAVIGLAQNLFYGTGLAPCVLILRSPERKSTEEVLFINAEELFDKGKNQNSLEEVHTNKILDAYQNRKEIQGFSRVVSLDEIRQNDYNLNIPNYVSIVAQDTSESLNTTSAKYLDAFEEYLSSREMLLKEISNWEKMNG
jgi:type I restriction enzyme M protein